MKKKMREPSVEGHVYVYIRRCHSDHYQKRKMFDDECISKNLDNVLLSCLFFCTNLNEKTFLVFFFFLGTDYRLKIDISKELFNSTTTLNDCHRLKI